MALGHFRNQPVVCQKNPNVSCVVQTFLVIFETFKDAVKNCVLSTSKLLACDQVSGIHTPAHHPPIFTTQLYMHTKLLKVTSVSECEKRRLRKKKTRKSRMCA